MQVKAVAKYIKVQPRKVRIIADKVRETSAPKTVAVLRYHTSKSARELRKVLISAMANAQENHGIAPEDLKIAAITVDEGPRQKRMRARAMGRGMRITKKTSHITVTVEDGGEPVKVKPHGTKAKPRPTFKDAKKGKGKAKAEAKAKEEVVEVTETAPEETVAEVTPEVEATAPETTEESAAEPAETPEAEEAAADEDGEK